MNYYLNLSFKESLDIAGTLILIRETRRSLGYNPWELSDHLLIKQSLSAYFVELTEEKRLAKDQTKLEL
jgi:hypothetical protein